MASGEALGCHGGRGGGGGLAQRLDHSTAALGRQVPSPASVIPAWRPEQFAVLELFKLPDCSREAGLGPGSTLGSQ